MDFTPVVIRVVLELTAGRQPLAGSVRAADGRVIPFRGWLELAAAIEQSRLMGERGGAR